jgi:hypothetical protein
MVSYPTPYNTKSSTKYEILTLPHLHYGTNLNANVCIFHKAIQANGEKNNVDIINLFCFTLCDAIFEWGENLLNLQI